MQSRPWPGSSFAFLIAGALSLAPLLMGCQPASRADDRVRTDATMFGPTDLRIHPFTSIKDWDADGQSNGLEALIELQDRFRDPTKATGTVIFELYSYERTQADHRGTRLAYWRGTLLTLEEQKMHWNRISRTYSFQLAYPEISTNKSYVLEVWFEHAGKRLTSQVVLETQEPKGVVPTAPTPVTRPAVTQPVAPPAVTPPTITPAAPGTRTPAP